MGIPIEIDRSALLLYPIVVMLFLPNFWSHALQFRFYPDHVLAIVSTSLFLLCLFFHELGHAAVARYYGLPVHSMRFFVFGGLTEIAKPPRASQELAIALAGPLVSAGLGVGLMSVSPAGSQTALLGWINLMLAAFNLLPVFPLDGGRAIRGFFWMVSGNYDASTRLMIQFGRVLAIALILLGAGLVLTQNLAVGALVVVAGWRLKTSLTPNFQAI
jgi:Zn-dependent protease